MVHFITSLKQLNMAELLDVHQTSSLERGQYLLPQGTQWERLRIGEDEMREYMHEFFTIEGSVLATLNDGNKMVCVARLEPFQDGYLLTGLETAPKHRKRGYATTLLNAIDQQIPQIIFSHIKKDNRASVAVHKKAGFVVLNDFAHLLDGTVSRRYYTMALHAK